RQRYPPYRGASGAFADTKQRFAPPLQQDRNGRMEPSFLAFRELHDRPDKGDHCEKQEYPLHDIERGARSFGSAEDRIGEIECHQSAERRDDLWIVHGSPLLETRKPRTATADKPTDRSEPGLFSSGKAATLLGD